MADELENDELDTPPTAIKTEQALEQRSIPFIGDDLAAARTTDGGIYVTLPGMCRALGLNTQSQFRRIGRTTSLAKGLRVIPLDTGGGVQMINCLRVDRVALWLSGVETSRIKPEYRAKIEAYQDELAPVAMQVFMRVLGVQTPTSMTSGAAPTATSIEISEIRGQIDTLYSIANLLQEHLAGLLSLPGQVTDLQDQMGQALSMLEALADRQDTLDERQDHAQDQIARIDERTQRLTTAHARVVQDQVNRMVQETQHMAIPLTWYIIYGRLKQRFRASSYREIADEQYPVVMAYLQEELRRALAGEAPEQGSLF